MKKSILILGASELQVPAIKCAKSLKLRTIVVDYDDKAPGKKEADIFYNVSTLDAKAVLQIALKEKIDGIVTICSDKPMTVVAEIGEKLGLNTISTDTALSATNKAYMRNTLQHNGVPIPKFFICNNKDDYFDAISSIEMPFIVKPSDNSGSRGVFMVNDIKDIDIAYKHAVSNTECGTVLVEEYIDGVEVSVEVFVTSGSASVIQITDKMTSGAPYFVEIGHNQPSNLPPNTCDKISNVAIQATEALGIDKGPAHVEIKVNGEDIKVIELGARLGGDYIATDLVPLSTGFNLVEATLLCALNEACPHYDKIEQCAAIRYFEYNDYINLSPDVITSINRIYVSKRKNKLVKSSRDREGFYIVTGKNRDEIDMKISKINDMIL